MLALVGHQVFSVISVRKKITGKRDHAALTFLHNFANNSRAIR
jgi:hypothetical protein